MLSAACIESLLDNGTQLERSWVLHWCSRTPRLTAPSASAKKGTAVSPANASSCPSYKSTSCSMFGRRE